MSTADADHRAVAAFLYREARLADEARYAEWLLLSRGLHREVVDDEGRTVSHVTDETTNRGFWHHFRTVMSEP